MAPTAKNSRLLAAADLMFFRYLESLTTANQTHKELASLFLPSTKTSRNRGETVAYRYSEISLPVPITCSSRTSSGSTVLAQETHSLHIDDEAGRLHCLTRNDCLNRCNKVWGPRGIPKITGH
ncbi:hypothetical protein BT96DRAFT_1009284 [Gymnopus androsaceus JB14]|uniref:Uncharacterized protein n=1 Tax=Gymnopus androsaceus JB14 TaxID=1447944 RepID=A0A6A4GCV9_9AGAR|nr:hypothetical protein BT96DRAFT_1009284 [Gymnopus androsaceus JB14]